jgi:hypothetical protein
LAQAFGILRLAEPKTVFERMSKGTARPPHGVEFPLDGEGNRPTMGVNKAAFAAALRAVSAQDAKAIDDLPEKKWRRAYAKQLVEQVRHSAKTPEAALSVAGAGLDYLHNTMVFVRPEGGTEIPLSEAMKTFREKRFKTHEIQGTSPRASNYTVQYKSYGTPGSLKTLSGDALHKQIDTWVKNGAIEMSCGSAMSKVIDNPGWTDLSDTYFVLFGATSAMGPFHKLMELGANIIALDLDRPQIWEKLLKDTRAGSGKLIFPVKEEIKAGASDADIAKVAGCNLLTDAPEIRNWLVDLFPKERLVCMALAYLDGALFVKVSIAMDAIIKSLIEERGVDKVIPAYLCTPTDAHLCTPASVEAAKANFRRSPAWQGMLAPVLTWAGMPMKKNVERPIVDANGNELEGLHVVDCIIPEQGPNYILAKRLQHWRAMVSRAAGCTVSSNIAPSTATASVLSNVLFALSYKGMSSFRPMEITYQETSNSVMSALLIRDLRDSTSASNPKTPLLNPLCLFTDNAWHGGCWRSGWKFASMGAPSLLGYVFFAFAVTPYLFLYNAYQAVGWGRALITVLGLLSSRSGLWNEVGSQISFFQHLGMMEVCHAAIGLTRSSPALTFMQIFSRFFVVALLNCCPEAIKEDTSIIPMMLTAWCIADFTRYVFYCFGLARDLAGSCKSVAVALKLLKVKSVERADDPAFQIPFPLVWIRYSLFIVLYPTGVFGELMVAWMTRECMMSALSTLQPNTMSGWIMQTMKFLFECIGMRPNSNIYYAGIFLAYVFGLPPLYMTLLASRRKQLAPAPKTDKAKKGR